MTEQLHKFYEDPFSGYNFGLTKKEAEAARLVALGYLQKDIAKDLGISEQALRKRLSGACKKMKVASMIRWLK